MHYDNGYLTDKSCEKTLFCPECGELIGLIDIEMQSYVFCAVCSCGALIKRWFGEMPSAGSLPENTYLSAGKYICPKCGRMLFKLEHQHLRSISFATVCCCGGVFSGATALIPHERELYRRAALMPTDEDQ